MNKYILSLLTTTVVVAALVGFRDHLTALWAMPAKVETVEQAVVQQTTIQQHLHDIVTKHETEREVQKEVQKLSIESLKEQLQLIKEMRTND